MTYYFSRIIEGGFDEVVGRTREALKQEGFEVIALYGFGLRERVVAENDYTTLSRSLAGRA